MTGKKTYRAYAIDDFEMACGCTDCRFYECYEADGNTIRRFDDYDEAVKAAKVLMREMDADRWNVI